MICHFDRSDALRRAVEKSVKINRFLDSLRSLGMTVIIVSTKQIDY